MSVGTSFLGIIAHLTRTFRHILLQLRGAIIIVFFFFFLSFLDLVKKNFVDVFCFGVCPVGFKFCRPVLMINGTFFKGKHITN